MLSRSSAAMNPFHFWLYTAAVLTFLFWAAIRRSSGGSSSGGSKEAFVPVSTCAKDPYVENRKTYWKGSDVAMCRKGDTCQVQRDSKGRIEFALCVSPNIFHGSI